MRTAAVDASIPELTPQQLAARIERGDDFDLIDVREPHEWDIAKLPGARLVPLATLPATLGSLDSAREIVVYCKSGVRSLRAASQLQAAGFRRCRTSPAASCGGAATWTRACRPTEPVTFRTSMPMPCCCDRCTQRSGQRHVRWSPP